VWPIAIRTQGSDAETKSLAAETRAARARGRRNWRRDSRDAELDNDRGSGDLRVPTERRRGFLNHAGSRHAEAKFAPSPPPDPRRSLGFDVTAGSVVRRRCRPHAETGRAGPAARKFAHDVALALRKGGKSWRAIGRELGVSPSTLRDALARLQRAS